MYHTRIPDFYRCYYPQLFTYVEELVRPTRCETCDTLFPFNEGYAAYLYPPRTGGFEMMLRWECADCAVGDD